MTHTTRVKICGMKSHADVKLAINCGADAVGFITDVPVETPRKIDLNTAAELISRVPIFVDTVLVIMPDDAKHALEMIETAKPDVVQIHNNFAVDELEIIRKNTATGIVKTISIPVNTRGTADTIDAVVKQINDLTDRGLVDGILLDSSAPGKVGGTGAVHDWSVSRAVVEAVDMSPVPVPVILAGGLNPDNVGEAVKSVLPYAVDTASGIETDGKKDEKKICRFIHEARCER
ncbi:MAG: phosphoribosylanthranilate isomerase [Methanosarcinaceae archaeon]|nr:phosphoribosylanthranilate isomerase [Methanosarcinaceae archaeon]